MKKLIVIIIDLLWTIQNLKKIPSCSWFFSIPPNTMLHITMSNTVKVVLSYIALGFRKEKNTGVFLGSIYLSIHLCLCLRHSKALQLLSSGQWGGWKVLQLACSPTAGQYFYRLCDCSACTQICLHFPCHPLPQSWRLCTDSPSVVYHITYNPSVTNHLANFSQRSLFFFLAIRDTRIVPFLVYFCAPLITASPQFVTMWVGDKLAGKSPKRPEWC